MHPDPQIAANGATLAANKDKPYPGKNVYSSTIGNEPPPGCRLYQLHHLCGGIRLQGATLPSISLPANQRKEYDRQVIPFAELPTCLDIDLYWLDLLNCSFSFLKSRERRPGTISNQDPSWNG